MLIETNATDISYKVWKASYDAYKAAAEANRPVYRAIRKDAGLLGMDAAAFDAACRAEIDEDVAADDSGEWIRAARVVLDGLAPEPECEPAGWEEKAWAAAQWARACDYQLQLDDQRW